MSDEQDLARRVDALRRAFDASFATKPIEAATDVHDFLVVRAGGDGWALPLRAVAQVDAGHGVTPAPSAMPALLGLASIRRALLPVYDLGALLGRDPTPRPRWLVVTATAPLALGLEALDRYLRVPSSEVVAVTGASDRAFVVGMIRDGATSRPILDVAALCDDIARRAGDARRSGGGPA